MACISGAKASPEARSGPSSKRNGPGTTLSSPGPVWEAFRRSTRDPRRAPLGWVSSAGVWEEALPASGASPSGWHRLENLGGGRDPHEVIPSAGILHDGDPASACSSGDSVPRRVQTSHVDRPAVSVRKGWAPREIAETLRSDHL